jgi:hypothetical protein
MLGGPEQAEPMAISEGFIEKEEEFYSDPKCDPVSPQQFIVPGSPLLPVYDPIGFFINASTRANSNNIYI